MESNLGQLGVVWVGLVEFNGLVYGSDQNEGFNCFIDWNRNKLLLGLLHDMVLRQAPAVTGVISETDKGPID